MLGKYFTVTVATERDGIDCSSTIATQLQDSFRLFKMEVIKLFPSHWPLLSFLHLNMLCPLSEWENALSSYHWCVVDWVGVPGFFVPYSKS